MRTKEFVSVFSEKLYLEKREFMEMLTKLTATDSLNAVGFCVVDQQVEWVKKPAFLDDATPEWACRVLNFVIDDLEVSTRG